MTRFVLTLDPVLAEGHVQDLVALSSPSGDTCANDGSFLVGRCRRFVDDDLKGDLDSDFWTASQLY